ncbi:flagellar biosynthetic protein FliO [Herbaspirillum sp. DW155]|uniref:flagellar biosynthetic protein FliO n=1 Tax=Herbaspirillum sp. DW155 TaxID=3095609 RepID=UPI003093643A|nr:flagellar biosynthetic protein FliO [Herbaspirillum sp. DW155]
MTRFYAVSLLQGLRRIRPALTSALLLLGGSLIATAQAWADNAPAGSSTAAASPVASTPPAAAPAAAGTSLPSSTGSAFTMLFGLVAVLAVMAAVAWLVKRFGLASSMGGNGVAKVVGGVSVGTRERVIVVEVGEQWIVVGVAPGRVNALATLPRQEGAAAQPAAAAPAFATWLKHTMDKRNGGTGNGDRPGNDGSTR